MKISNIKNIVSSTLLSIASVFSPALAGDPKKEIEGINVPYLTPSTYTPFQQLQNNNHFVSVHGINQTSNAWANVNQAMQNRGFQTTAINLPNNGHNGWEQNRIVINNTLSNIQGSGNVFFGYSLGAVSTLRYMEENPKFIENNRGSTFILLDPAITQHKHIEFLASLPIRPMSKTESELVRMDNNRFIDTTLTSLPTLAENLAKSNWNIHLVNLNSEVVNGNSIKSLADTFKTHNVNVYQHTPADVMNNYVPPTIGNRGVFPGGNDTIKVPTTEFIRDNSSHFIWSNTYKSAINEFIANKASQANSVKLEDIVSSSGILQNYPILKDDKLQVMGGLSDQFQVDVGKYLAQPVDINKFINAQNLANYNLNIIGTFNYNFNSNPYNGFNYNFNSNPGFNYNDPIMRLNNDLNRLNNLNIGGGYGGFRP
mgnify:CR=1 FL=1